MTTPRRLIDELNDLHAEYVDQVNRAIAEDDEVRAYQLAEDYDTEAVQMVAEREGKTHLLPLRRRTWDTPLRRMAKRSRDVA
jgi:hypothetical protein